MSVDIAAAARALVERACREQGLPIEVEDDQVLAGVAALVGSSKNGPARGTTPRPVATCNVLASTANPHQGGDRHHAA